MRKTTADVSRRLANARICGRDEVTFSRRPPKIVLHVCRTIGVLTVVLAVLSAQENVRSSTASFEVASVKINTGGDRASSFRAAGDFVATNVPLRTLINYAYDIDPNTGKYTLQGGLEQVLSSKFDVVGKAPANSSDRELRPMVAKLLAERFALRTHVESRMIPIFELTVAKAGRLGKKLSKTTINCRQLVVAREERPTLCLRNTEFLPDGLRLHNAGELSDLVQALQPWADRLIVDKTGLTGSYEWDLQFAPPRVKSELLPMYSATVDQLGLRLAEKRASVDVRVIDNVSAPTEN